MAHCLLLSIAEDPAPQSGTEGTDVDLQLLEAAKAGDLEVVKVMQAKYDFVTPNELMT